MRANFDGLSPKFFDRTPPSRADVLQALALALGLLAQSLPLAVQTIGAQPADVQMRFWWAFIDFDKGTDMDGTGGYDGALELETWRVALRDWANVCNDRIDIPDGDLTASEVNS